MKKIGLLSLLLVGLFTIACAFAEDEKKASLAIGSEIPMADVKMANATGDAISLAKLKSENGTLVVFSCNTCPFVIAYEDRIRELQTMCEKSGISMAIINSNEAKRSGDDSLERMMDYAKSQRLTVPYLVDNDAALADAFGAYITPEVFLFDKEGKLAYKGAIDDNWKDSEKVENFYVTFAMKAVLSGEAVEINETKAKGCSIKRP